MLIDPISRRGFFGQAAVAPAAGLIQSGPVERPKRAYAIMEVGWEYNDEFCTEVDGGHLHPRLYYYKAEADEECRKLSEKWPGMTPYEWSPPESAVQDALEHSGKASEEELTWADYYESGFPAPYYVVELESEDKPS